MEENYVGQDEPLRFGLEVGIEDNRDVVMVGDCGNSLTAIRGVVWDGR